MESNCDMWKGFFIKIVLQDWSSFYSNYFGSLFNKWAHINTIHLNYFSLSSKTFNHRKD